MTAYEDNAQGIMRERKSGAGEFVSILGFLSPLSTTLLGWLILNETLNVPQAIGMALVLGGVFLGQHALRPGKE